LCQSPTDIEQFIIW